MAKTIKCQRCHRVVDTKKEHYSLHMERRGPEITVIEDRKYCKSCGDLIASTGRLFR